MTTCSLKVFCKRREERKEMRNKGRNGLTLLKQIQYNFGNILKRHSGRTFIKLIMWMKNGTPFLISIMKVWKTGYQGKE